MESQSGSTVEMGLGRGELPRRGWAPVGSRQWIALVRLRKRLGLAARGKTRPVAVHLDHLAKVRIPWPGGVGAPIVVRLGASRDASG